MTTSNTTRVCVVGLWHLGIVNAVGFAEKGYTVVGIEFDEAKALTLQQGTPPLFEPGLEELQQHHLKSGRLSFSSDVTVVHNADAVVIAYDSPVNDKDEVDITPIVEAAKKIAPHLQPSSPLIITSQLPLGSSEQIEALVKKINPEWQSGVVYTPENLRLGNAIERFKTPDMIVLGASNQLALKAAKDLYSPFETTIIPMSHRSAEMVKHALNVFLATAIAYGNEIANVADRLGADAVDVATALKCDKRINKAPIFPGLGFSGGTLARDVTQLQKFSKQLNYPALLIESIIAINEGTFDEIVLKLNRALHTVNGKKIGILGLTYKPGTSTMRRSPAIKIIQKLVDRGATCFGYDPVASIDEFSQYTDILTRVNSPEKLAKNSDALVLVTEWPEFSTLNYTTLAQSMATPIFIDTKNFLDPQQLTDAGFQWQGYGRKGT